MHKLRIGLIGAGMIAESAHVPSLLRSDHVEFSIIVESSLERARSLNNKFGVNIPIVTSLDDVTTEIDAVILCTPNDSHKEICLRCFERGIHVFVEKPLANTYQDARAILEAALSSNCVLMVGYCTRFWPSVQYVKEIVNTCPLGKVKRFVFQYGAAGGWAPYSNYMLSKKKSGGGAFIINASHYLDRMLWYFGIPDEFSFWDDAKGGLEANAIAEFKYAKDESFKGIIRVSKTVNLDSGCFIEFEKGIVILRDWKDPLLTIKFSGIERKLNFLAKSGDFSLRTRPDMYSCQLREFTSRIKGENIQYLSSIEDAVYNVKITEELYKKRSDLDCDWYKI